MPGSFKPKSPALQIHNTIVTMSPAQRKRLIQGYDGLFNRVDPEDVDVWAGEGALKSTASDMLTYLDANLRPEKYASTSVSPFMSTRRMTSAHAQTSAERSRPIRCKRPAGN